MSTFDEVWTKVAEELRGNLTVEEYKERLAEVEKIIMPFLTNLLKTADQPYIHWPNRGPAIEKQMQKILKLTRG